jgi:hypothetical protein
LILKGSLAESATGPYTEGIGPAGRAASTASRRRPKRETRASPARERTRRGTDARSRASAARRRAVRGRWRTSRPPTSPYSRARSKSMAARPRRIDERLWRRLGDWMAPLKRRKIGGNASRTTCVSIGCPEKPVFFWPETRTRKPDPASETRSRDSPSHTYAKQLLLRQRPHHFCEARPLVGRHWSVRDTVALDLGHHVRVGLVGEACPGISVWELENWPAAR